MASQSLHSQALQPLGQVLISRREPASAEAVMLLLARLFLILLAKRAARKGSIADQKLLVEPVQIFAVSLVPFERAVYCFPLAHWESLSLLQKGRRLRIPQR